MTPDTLIRAAIHRAANAIGLYILGAALVLCVVQPVVAGFVNNWMADRYQSQAMENMQQQMQDAFKAIPKR